MTVRKRVPTIIISNEKGNSITDRQDFLNLWVGNRNKPLSEWPKPGQIQDNRQKKQESNRQYFHDKKGANVN